MVTHLFSSNGRISRAGYIGPHAAFYALTLVAGFSMGGAVSASAIGEMLRNAFSTIGAVLDASVLGILPLPLQIALAIFIFGSVTWVFFALTVKRLHDLGRSGWWSVASLIPVLGTLLVLICAIVPGRKVPA